MHRVITRALLVMLLTVAAAAGYQWASRYDGPGPELADGKSA